MRGASNATKTRAECRLETSSISHAGGPEDEWIEGWNSIFDPLQYVDLRHRQNGTWYLLFLLMIVSRTGECR